MAVRSFPRDACIGRARHWLVEVTWAGQVWRVSDAALEVLTDAGDSLVYHPGLEPLTVTEEIELGAESISATTATVEALLPCDVPRLVALGHRLTGARIHVSRWVEDTTYEARMPLVSGRPKEAGYDVATGLVRFAVEQAVADDLSEVPPPLAQVDTTTWTTTAYLAAGDYAVPYPLVIGQPGRAPHLSRGYVSATRAAWTNKGRLNHTAVVAGHACTAGQVICLADDDEVGVRVAVQRTTDERGRTVTVLPADYPASDTTDSLGTAPLDVYWSGLESTDWGLGSPMLPAVADEIPLWLAWYDLTDPEAGGLLGERGEVVREAGDVLVYLLSLTSQRADRPAFESARQLLAAYRIDAVIDERVKVTEWILRHLLPILPLSLRATPWGIQPVVWRLDPTSDDAIATLDADTDPRIELADALDYETDPVYNSVRVDYTYSRARQAYQSHVVCGPAWDAADSDTVAHPVAAASLAALRVEGEDSGLRPITISSDVLYDRATAHRVAADYVAAYGMPRRTLAAVVPEDQWDWMPLGAAVRLTSADHRMSEQRAIIVAREWGEDGLLGLRLRIFERPAVDARYGQAGAA